MSALRAAAIAAATTVLALACGRQPLPLPTAPASGWRADALEVFDADRIRAIGASLGDDDALIVALWAHWCEPCIEELPQLSALSSDRPTWGVLSLGTDDLTSESTRKRVQDVLDRVRPHHPQGRIEAGQEFRLLDALGLEWDGILPKTFVWTRRGTFLVEARDRADIAAEVSRRLRGDAPP